jgi:hypothetical protein
MDGTQVSRPRYAKYMVSQAIMNSSKGGHEIGFLLLREIRNWTKEIYNFAKLREMTCSKFREIILQIGEISSYKLVSRKKFRNIIKFRELINKFHEICHI